jgi:hypothetical protein
MHTTSFEQSARAMILVAACVTFFCITVEHAHAQPLNTYVPPQAPVFNPSTPSIAPPLREAPVPSGLPSALPGSSGDLSPSIGITPSAITHSHRRAVTATAPRPHVAKHRRRKNDGSAGIGAAGSAAASDYHSPLSWAYSPYHACVWRRGWSGEWSHDCM